MFFRKSGPKEILVCVEGCMISPSDVTEFLKERRAAGSSAQGQEGTGIIVKVGSENLQDAKGNVLKVGDKVIAAKKAGFAVFLHMAAERQIQLHRMDGLQITSYCRPDSRYIR